MTQSDQALQETLDRLVPRREETIEWDDVIERATRQATTASWRRRRPRRVLVGVSVVAAVGVILFATPAFGLRSALLDLIGRTDVPFTTSKPAPNNVKKQFLDLDVRSARFPGRRFGVVVAADAREVGKFTINGHSRRLWVVPTASGGFCYSFEEASGSCNDGSAAHRKEHPLSVGWLSSGGPTYRVCRDVQKRRSCRSVRIGPAPGATPHPPTPTAVTQITGTITSPDAARLEILYADGARITIPFVWVSQPIAAGFFAYDIPTDRLTDARRPTALVLTDDQGRVLARDVIQSGSIKQVFPRPQPRPQQQFVAPSLPTNPSAPLQRGRGDGTSVVVGANGYAVFDMRETPVDRFPAQGTEAMYSCFRITKEFGISGVAGGNTRAASPQQLPAEVRVALPAAGPFDGCEISAQVGHTWPDKLRSHAPVEIPLTPRSRLYFTDRAAARNLKLFIRSARLRDAWSPGGNQLVSALTTTFGNDLTHLPSPTAPLAPGRIGYSLVPNGATFVETSPTGKRFTVTITKHFIAHQNLAPYTRAVLFWKRP